MINNETATRDPDIDLEERDFTVIDDMMNDVEAAFNPKVVEGLKAEEFQIQRWRWDIPEIVISWYTANKVGRNVRVLFEKQTSHHFRYQVEFNIWEDIQGDDDTIERRWRHQVWDQEIAHIFVREGDVTKDYSGPSPGKSAVVAAGAVRSLGQDHLADEGFANRTKI